MEKLQVRKQKITKGYYIHFGGNSLLGINNKIKMQIKELQKHFQCTEIEITAHKRNFLKRIMGIMPFCSIPWNYAEAKKLIQKPDYVYIRRVNADFKLILFFRWLRTTFPQCKILMEVPTYPYDRQAFQSFLSKPFGQKDRIFRHSYKKYVDCIISMTEEQEIFGLPNIRIKNGINFECIELVNKTDEDDCIDLLTVANFQPDHGYERVIYGLADYYLSGGKRTIKLHMVGDGKNVPEYKKLVNKLDMWDSVLFYGIQSDDALEKIYEIADIGLGAFGCYKSGIRISSVLKIREYLAKGLPVVSGIEEDLFQDDVNYSYYFGYDNGPDKIDISKIVAFYDNIYGSPETKIDIRKKIRESGRKLADMSVTYKPVVDYIRS